MNWRAFLRRRRGLAFALPAGIVAVLVLLAALNFDEGVALSPRESRIKDAQSLRRARRAPRNSRTRAAR